jgi:hypothetical protein
LGKKKLKEHNTLAQGGVKQHRHIYVKKRGRDGRPSVVGATVVILWKTSPGVLSLEET